MREPLLWNDWLAKIRGMLSEELFARFFSEMQLLNYQAGERLVVGIPPKPGVDLSDLQRLYGGILEQAWIDAGGGAISVQLSPGKSDSQSNSDQAVVEEKKVKAIKGVGLDPEYTFETFVEGKNSEFAVAVAKAVVNDFEDPRYNPLLIYGGVGLGKTHLLHAIGNQVRREYPHLSVRYVATNDFLQEFVSAMLAKKIPEMEDYYRQQVDLLLLDDVQNLEDKVETQNFFFNIFNVLYSTKKLIVLSSDRPINEVRGIHERLISRFQGGLSVDIQPPDAETREAIFRRKIMSHNIDCPDEVIRAISQQLGSNVRDLESVIRQLLFRSTNLRQPIDLNMVGDVLRNTLLTSSRRVTLDDVLKEVCDYYGVEKNRILEDGRGTKEVAQARQVAMYLLRKLGNLSHKSIGHQFGNRDHSTVVYAIKTVEKQINKDLSYRRSIDVLFGRLR